MAPAPAGPIAGSGQDDRCRALLAEDVDVVLSDIVIDGAMSGLDLAESVKARAPGLPVVLMTGYSEALARGSASGFTVLTKPFTQEEVAAAICKARGAGPGRSAGVDPNA